MINKLILSTVIATFATASFAVDTTSDAMEQQIALHAVDLADAEQLRLLAADADSDNADLQRLLIKASSN